MLLDMYAIFLPLPDGWLANLRYLVLIQVKNWLPRQWLPFFILIINAPVIIILFNVVWQVVKPRTVSEPPTVFHWLPVIGSAIEYGNDPLTFILNCQEKYGDVFTFILLGRKVTVALGSKGNNFVLGGKSTIFNAEDVYKHLTVPVFGKDVVYDIPNEKFMEQKKFVKVGLSTDNLRAYVGMIEDEIDAFFSSDPAFSVYQKKGSDYWGTFDTTTVMQEITILTASHTLQGKEVRSRLDKNFAQVYMDLDGGFKPINLIFPNLPLESYRKRDKAHQKMSQFYVDIIKKRRENSQGDEHDMISALMQQSYRNGDSVKDHEVAHLMITLLMAGQHTSSATGSWALLRVAANPDICKALYEEQVKFFSNPDGTLRSMTYDEIRSLPVMDSVIRETLRMHPPIHSIMRYVREDVAVPPSLSSPSKDSTTTYVIPKGHYVLASPLVSQMDPQVWKDAARWDPTRWNDPAGQAAEALNIYTDEGGEKVDYGFGAVSKGTESPYQPFGAGKHRCIGEQFAYLQLSTIIATFIRKMELRIEKVPENNYHTMVLMPKTPVHISYRRRHLNV